MIISFSKAIMVVSLMLLLIGACKFKNGSSSQEYQNSLYTYYLNKANFFEKNQELTKAIQYLDSAIILGSNPDILNQRGLLKEKIDDYTGALQDYEMAINNGGNYLINKCNVLISLKKEKEALACLEEVLKMDKDTFRYYISLSSFALKSMDTNMMNEIVIKAKELDNSSMETAVILNNQVVLYLQLNDTIKACQFLKEIKFPEVKEYFAFLDCTKNK